MGGSKTACFGVCASAFVYFVFFPGDLAALGKPIDELARAVSRPANTVLKLSTSVSPWLYGVVIAAILGRTVTNVWGKAPKAATKPPTKRKPSPKAT